MIVTVASGDTLSGIAAAHGESLGAIEAANPQIGNPNVIYVGEQVIVMSGGSWEPSSASSSTSTSASSSSTGSSGTSSGSGYHIPGVSDATAACIAFKESTNGQASANVFQLQQGYYPGMSLAQQEQVAGQLAATQGVQSAWGQYDGC
jgi:LysM repeat protein